MSETENISIPSCSPGKCWKCVAHPDPDLLTAGSEMATTQTLTWVGAFYILIISLGCSKTLPIVNWSPQIRRTSLWLVIKSFDQNTSLPAFVISL